MARLLAIETDHRFILLERPAFPGWSVGGGSGTLLEGWSLRGCLGGFGHGLSHLFMLPGELLKKARKKEVNSLCILDVDYLIEELNYRRSLPS